MIKRYIYNYFIRVGINVFNDYGEYKSLKQISYEIDYVFSKFKFKQE